MLLLGSPGLPHRPSRLKKLKISKMEGPPGSTKDAWGLARPWPTIVLEDVEDLEDGRPPGSTKDAWGLARPWPTIEHEDVEVEAEGLQTRCGNRTPEPQLLELDEEVGKLEDDRHGVDLSGVRPSTGWRMALSTWVVDGAVPLKTGGSRGLCTALVDAIGDADLVRDNLLAIGEIRHIGQLWHIGLRELVRIWVEDLDGPGADAGAGADKAEGHDVLEDPEGTCTCEKSSRKTSNRHAWN